MEVGDYVRTKHGRIGRIYNLTVDYSSELILCEESSIPFAKHQIINTSPNIIDLFEEHDLIVIEYYSSRYKERVTRLFEVAYRDKEFMTIKNAYCDFMLRNNEFNDKDKKLKPIIKSIVTKEQFESMEYKVDENK